MALQLSLFMDLVLEKKADELHIHPGVSPRVLLGGKMRPLYMEPLKAEETLQLFGEIAPKERLHELESNGSSEFSFTFEGLAMFRVSARMAEGQCGFVLHLEGTYLSSPELHLPVTDLDRRLSRRLDLPLKPYSSNIRLAKSVWDFAAGFGLRNEVVESGGRKVLKAWNSHSDQKYERPLRDEVDLPGELCRFILDILEGNETGSL